ncbi:MAG: MFS transporter [Cyclobacteriaceae bacterium]|jgi:dipeptide/tripeptide permease|nr:MFS transporter [Cyclobacteriaceae bacterium]
MGLRTRIQEIQTGFHPTFWVANTLELFERLAFYGSKGVLAVFIAERVGLNDEASTLAAFFTGLVYFLPILAGVVVDKYGFKKSLLICFAIFSIGYFLIGLAGLSYGQEITHAIGKKAYMLVVLTLTAIGGSLIKPCIVGTVAKTSKPTTQSLGFAIYYTLVNVGGAIGPVIALLIRTDWGIEYVLIMSSLTSALLFVGTWIFFREPQNDANVEARTFRKVFQDMLLVFGNFRFISFLIIFSGFWLMFWQIFLLVPFYSKSVLHFEEFELLEIVDAVVIVALTIPLSEMVRKWKPITAMIAGISIASVSWLVLGLFTSVIAAVLGIAIWAIGEAMQSPRFYEYVSKLAPPNQVGTFMGFAFLPVAIGAFGAGPIADWLRLTYMDSSPTTMWFVITGIGLLTTVLMLLYNRFVAPK